MFAFLAKQINAAKAVLDHFETTNPHTAGQVRMAVGGTLVADGLVGLENPFDGKKTRPGILGAVVIAVVGIIFMVVGVLFFGSEEKTDATTTGTVSSVSSQTTTSDGEAKTVCTFLATYVVDGQTYTAAPSGQSSSNCAKDEGEAVEVRYVSADPATGYVGTSARLMAWIPIGLGAFATLMGIATFLIRAASIVFGLTLLRSGRAMTQANPKTADDAGMVAEAKQAITNLLQGRSLDAAVPNAAFGAGFGAVGGGALGTLFGNAKIGAAIGALGGGIVAHQKQQEAASPTDQPPADLGDTFAAAYQQPAPIAPNVAVPATPTGVAPGWYDTADGLHQRWHDGNDWTEHTRPTGPPVSPTN